MIYEIVNPSDAYTIKSDIKAVACAACLCLGRGAYGLHDKHGTSILPPFILGGDPAVWFLAEFGTDLSGFLDASRLGIADCLDTIIIGSIDDREAVEAMLDVISNPDERDAAWSAWQDKQRSSMNDIGTWAKDLAAGLRKAQEG